MASTDIAADFGQMDDAGQTQNSHESTGIETTALEVVVADGPEAGASVTTEAADPNEEQKAENSRTIQDEEQEVKAEESKVKEEVQCSQGHPLTISPKSELIKIGAYGNGYICNVCREHKDGTEWYNCKDCQFDLCDECYREQPGGPVMGELTKLKREVSVLRRKMNQPEEEGKIKKLLGKAKEKLGKFLQYALYATWVLHFHALILLCCPMVFCCESCISNLGLCGECVEMLIVLMAFSFMFATPYVVTLYLINEVGGLYPEVQSWQISYCIWSTSCGILMMILIIGGQKSKSRREFQHFFQNLILKPFGARSGSDDDIIMWLVPLVSFAIAIVGGFFANYALDERYLLKCDPTYTDGMCFEELCCRPIGSHEVAESSRFAGDLASNILAGWGVVKGLTYFILMNDHKVDAGKQEDGWVRKKKKGKEDENETRERMEDQIENSTA